jgi:hypothetical protein
MLNIEPAYDTAVILLGICPREINTDLHAKTPTQMLLAAHSRKTKSANNPNNPSPNEWVVLHSYNGIFFFFFFFFGTGV